MSLNTAKVARFVSRTLVLIPGSGEKYDGSHISIVYFAVLSLSLLGQSIDTAPIEEYLAALWVGNGYKPSVSYSSDTLNLGGGATLTATYFALAIRTMLGLAPLSDAERVRVLEFVKNCQSEDGRFHAMALNSTETSLRHSYAAHAITQLLRASPQWLKKSVDYIISCQNYDGGFGESQLDESHGGLTYCAVASLHIANTLDRINRGGLIAYIAKRQLPDGGHNGRPNKPSDVCYSYWTCATANLLGIQPSPTSINAAQTFILGPGSDELIGGFVKSPGEMADPYHTALALSALSLLNTPPLRPLDPQLTLVHT